MVATPGTATPATMTASATHSRSTGPPDTEVDTAAASMVDTIDEPVLDIEHMPVENDPRMWSPARKVCTLDERVVYIPDLSCQNLVLVLISSGSMIAGFAANIQNRAIIRRVVAWPDSIDLVNSRDRGYGRRFACYQFTNQLERVAVHIDARQRAVTMERYQRSQRQTRMRTLFDRSPTD